MSSILKLRILGIRAFDNHEAQEIEFSSPLTLICGANGVGKTTIIECLRYVTTGDLPPNAKGGAFVHDPRMSSEGEVKAQIKLLFKNTGGERMVAARNMRLSVTGKGTSSFKTLEGFVKVQASNSEKDRTETAAISSRCADLNIQIPLALGVPSPILNYVVFCHQEDSLWPLAEPSIVKKRFDEIFEATKYTKALEMLKVIRKDYNSDIKVEKVEVEHLKTDRERAREKQRSLGELESKILDLQEESDELQNQRVAKTAQLNEVVGHSQKVQKLEYERNDLQRQRDRTAEDIDTLANDIEEPLSHLSADEIQSQVEGCDTRESKLDVELGELQSSQILLQKEIEESQQELAVIANQRGRIEQLQEEISKKIALRNEIVSSSDGEGNPENLENWRGMREKELAVINEEIEQTSIAYRQDEEKVAQKLSGLEAEKLQLRQVISTARSSKQRLETQANSLRSEIAKLGDTLDENTALRERLETLETDTRSADTRLHQFEIADTLGAAATEVNQAERHCERTHAQVQEAIEVSSAQSKLQYLQDSQREIKKAVESAENELRSVVRRYTEDGDNVEEMARSHLNTLSAQKKADSDAVTKLSSQLRSTESVLEGQVSKRQRLETSLKKTLGRLNDPAIFENYDELMREAEDALLQATEEQEQLAFAHSYFEKALAVAEDPKGSSCLLCGHHKSTHEEAEGFVTKLKSMIAALKINPKEAEQETEARRTELEALRSQRPHIERARALKGEITDIDAEIETSSQKVTQINTDLEHAAHQSDISTSLFDEASGELMPLLVKLSRTQEEQVEINKRLDIETSVSQFTPGTKTPQEAQQDMDRANELLKQARNKFETARNEHDRLKSQFTKLSHNVQELKLRLSDNELKLSKRKQAESELENVVGQLEKTQSDLSAASESLPLAETKIAEVQAKLKKMKHDSAQVERKLAEKRSALVSRITKFDELTEDIEAFQSSHDATSLTQLNDSAVRIKASIEEHRVKLSAVNEKVANVEKQRTDFGSFKRNLTDNMRLRNLEAKLRKLDDELNSAVARLEAAQAEIGSDYEQTILKLQDQVGELNHRISTMTGEVKALGQQMQQIKDELATSYSDTERQFHKALTKLETMETAADDLVKYVKALDSAIMEYHSIKMAEINALLDIMWKRTYMGTDIDTILIRSESDVGAASTRASYNYRVCMVKQDTELDMRGRCSAGQKVLASILIRMALAECFGNSSGLIVLDEPTTNLDRENIDALAQSLSDIIDSRRAQRNFQLIVITHDEHFLAQMSPASYCNHYYRIARDSRQLSKVQKLPITGLN